MDSNDVRAGGMMPAEMAAEVPAEVQIIEARQQAEFLLTPVGQALKSFEVTQRMGQMYAKSSIVPDTYRETVLKGGTWQRNEAAVANCAIAIDMATRMQCNPVMVMQNLYIVHGMPGWSSKFLIATINKSGRFSPIRYEFKGEPGGDDYACRAFAYEAADVNHKEPLLGTWVSLKMAKDEGWSAKPGSKWKTMPELMLQYRAAAFWQRVYCPEISMGLETAEEIQDIQPAEPEVIRPERVTPTDNLAALSAKAAQMAKERQGGKNPYFMEAQKKWKAQEEAKREEEETVTTDNGEQDGLQE